MPFNDDFRPEGHRVRRTRSRYTGPLVVLLLMLLAVAAAIWLWTTRAWAPEPPVTVPPAATVMLPPAMLPDPAIRHPVEEAQAPPDVRAALTDLLGRKAVGSLLQLGDFPRRFVATVDSLGREHSPPALWPVVPPAGRFDALNQNGGAVIAPDNSARYLPLVHMAEALDTRRTAELYRGIYPQLQSAYQELGHRTYFNDRLIEVIDQLLAAPEPAGPVRVQLLEIKGPMADPRPWVRWDFADPQLQSLTAGQKIMVRVGLENERRLKKKLAALRAELARGPAPAR